MTKNDEKIFGEMLDKLDANVNRILNPATEECIDFQGCMYQEVCDRKTATCALALSLQGKPLPPACQALHYEEGRLAQEACDNETVERYDERSYAEIMQPVVEKLFEDEKIPFDNWYIFEIPVWSEPPFAADDFIAVAMENDVTNQAFDLIFKEGYKLTEIGVIDYKGNGDCFNFETIKEALESPYSCFK